ncbi:DUF433 domain-containing protein [Mesorhizobium sp. IMUNJ 23232]|uniref:DUF433 domain-containing protein n=1 Tax=Mesorhizobium sp. IMUNJ 23232 TaxID=3376064 RepID=UPI00379E52F7
MRKKRIVASAVEAAEGIAGYFQSVGSHPALAARLSRHPAWYAVRNAAGEWMFGPSKFVGYRGMNAEDYLVSGYDRKDGRETEPTLAAWFDEVEADTVLGMELRDAFARFAANMGKTPNKRWRVSVLRTELRARSAAPPIDSISDRIDFHPDICGGRPRIKGTRIRVSDIVSALGTGETIAEILEDFPYLTEADIYAALDYAAKATDHRVLRAA